MKSPAVKKSNAKWLKIIGAVLAVCGLAACWSTIEMMIWLGGVEPWYIEELLWALAIAAAGGAMFCSGVSIGRSLKRYNKYLAVVGNYEAMAVEQLCRTLGYSRDRVEKDLQKMIDKGYFGDEAYLNMELGYLFRSGQGFEHQLDELYKADAMDVDSDIRVMETMLERDTASVEKDFGLGEFAAEQKPEETE